MSKLRREIPKTSQLGATTWKVTLKKCVERFCEMAQKTFDQPHKVSTPCFDEYHVKTRRSGNCVRTARDLPSDGVEMLVFGKFWKIQHHSGQ